MDVKNLMLKLSFLPKSFNKKRGAAVSLFSNMSWVLLFHFKLILSSNLETISLMSKYFISIKLVFLRKEKVIAIITNNCAYVFIHFP